LTRKAPGVIFNEVVYKSDLFSEQLHFYMPRMGKTNQPRATPWVIGRNINIALKGRHKLIISPLQG